MKNEPKKPWLILKMCKVSRHRFKCLSQSRLLTIDNHRKFSTGANVLCYLLCVCQKIIYFVDGISWHWIYGRTIEPPGNSFLLCAQTIAMKCSTPTAAICHIELARIISLLLSRFNVSAVSVSPPNFPMNRRCMAMTIASNWQHGKITLIIHLSIVGFVLRWTQQH